jgi:short-subunit dehydrogenase
MKRLDDRVAVITGAAGGIGQSLAQALAAAGCHLALVDIDPARLDQVSATLRAPGRRVSVHVVDVTARTEVAALPAAVTREHGAAHILVNNAGVSVAGRFEAVPLADLDWIFAVNVWGVVHGCHAFLPLLRAQEEAHIVNVGSSFGLLGMAGKTGYAATKAAVRGFSEALRAELAGSRVGLSVLYPGPVDSGIVQRGRAADPAQQAAEARFLASRALPPERAARAMLRAIRRNHSRVLVGLDYRLIDWVARLSPALAAWLAGRLAQRMPF